MKVCALYHLLFRGIPVGRFQGYLLRTHMERCPRCQALLADRQDVRSLLFQEGDVRDWEDPWPGIEKGIQALDRTRGRDAERLLPSFHFRYALAGIVAVLAVVLSLWFNHDYAPQPPVARAETPERFTLNYLRIGDEPADAFIYQLGDSRLTVVWAGKKTKGGVS